LPGNTLICGQNGGFGHFHPHHAEEAAEVHAYQLVKNMGQIIRAHLLPLGDFREADFVGIIFIHILDNAADALYLHIVVRCFVDEGFFRRVDDKAPEVVHQSVDQGYGFVVDAGNISG